MKLFPGARYSVDFAVEVVIGKYLDHQPLERQVRTMAHEGRVVDSQALWDQVERLARILGSAKEALHVRWCGTSPRTIRLELLLETSYRGVLHTSDATVLGRVEFAQRVADSFGLRGTIVPVETADVRLLAPRPLRGELRVDRAARLLRTRPLDIDRALERFWGERSARVGAT
jgi:hypothetical protein